jgi:hypothetical protein
MSEELATAVDLEGPQGGNNYIAPDVGIPGPGTHLPKKAAEQTQTQSGLDEGEKSSLAKTLIALNERVAATNESARLLADPNIRQYLELKAKGVDAKLVINEPTQVKPPEPPPEPENLETLTNAQLTKYMTDRMGHIVQTTIASQVDAKLKAQQDALTPVLQQLVADSQRRNQNDTAAQFKVAESRYPDWKQMLPSMIEVNKTVMGASPEELYLLAKARAGLPLVPPSAISTERPGQTPASRKTFERPASITGKTGFDALARAALEARSETAYSER